MSPASIVGDLETAHQSIRAGALLLRMVATCISTGEGAPALDMPLVLSFIADGLLERVEILEYATEQLETAAAEPVEGGRR